MSDRRQKPNSVWVPSLTEIVFVSMLTWLFFAGAGAVSLLTDGDTGWHIRTGEYILSQRAFPHQDLFSFSRTGAQWFAWEWLSDVIFAVAHKAAGLTGVVLLSGVVIAATSALLFRYMIWQESNVLMAVTGMLVASSVFTTHWLARPHLFSYLFFPVAIWILESDRRSPSRRVFWLVGLSILWTNLHGGFAGLVATVGIYLAGCALETAWTPAGSRNWTRAKRYGLLFGFVAAATLVSPYGYQLHRHIFQFLRSDFILNNVMEFRPPDFRAEGMRYFELILFGGLTVIPALLRRKDVTMSLLLLFWAHAALTSRRHMLMYVIVATPLVVRELTLLLDRVRGQGRGWLATFKELAADYSTARFGGPRTLPVGWLSPLAVVIIGSVLFASRGREYFTAQFPKLQFPVQACRAAGSEFPGRRILTSDQWGDYLIYRYYPKLKVFIDGRSDFYGPELGDEYLRLMNSHHEWEKISERHGFDLALLPTDWPLATTIKANPNWKVKYDDGRALLLERVKRAESENAAAARAASNPTS